MHDQHITPKDQDRPQPSPIDYANDLRAEFPDLDITDEQAAEVLTTLFELMATHVRMGFGLEPVGSLLASFKNTTADMKSLVNSQDMNGGARNE